MSEKLKAALFIVAFTFQISNFKFQISNVYADHGCLECDQRVLRHSGANECSSAPLCQADGSSGPGTCQGGAGLIGSPCDLASFEPSPTPLPEDACTPEECAVDNLNRGLIPKQVSQGFTSEKKNILQQLFDSVRGRFSWIPMFNKIPYHQTKFYYQSENINQASLPQEVRPLEEDGVFEKIKGFLGSKTGYYPVNIAPLDPCSDKVQDSEECYEQSNFPEGIKPILDPPPQTP